LEQLGWPTSFEFSSIAGGDLIEVTAAIRGMKYRAQRLLCSLWGNYASAAGEDCPYTKAMVYELLLAAKVKSVSVVFVVCGTREAFLPLNPAISQWYDNHMNWLRQCIKDFGGTVFSGTTWLPHWPVADSCGHVVVVCRPLYAKFLRLCINLTVSSKLLLDGIEPGIEGPIDKI